MGDAEAESCTVSSTLGGGEAIGGWPCQIGPSRHDAHGCSPTITFWTITTLISFGRLAQSSSEGHAGGGGFRRDGVLFSG